METKKHVFRVQLGRLGLLLTMAVLGVLAPATLSAQSGGEWIVDASPCLSLRAQPWGEVLGCLPNSSVVQVEQQRGDWSRVESAQGTGWVASKHLGSSPAATSNTSLTTRGEDVLTYSPGTEGKASRAACAPDCETDIGELMEHPTTTFKTVTTSCAGTGGCSDCFEMVCPVGSTVTLSFCQGGGSADFDTGISAFDGPKFINEAGCDDDTCATLSELLYTFTEEEPVRFRVGGFETASGSYTLAYRVDDTTGQCRIMDAVPVKLQHFSIE